MSAGNKARNKALRVKGATKEAAGRVMNDREMQARGKADQRRSHLKDAGEKVKDAFRIRRQRRV